MVDPFFLALTRTPSSASCPAVTLPDSAGEPVCAAATPVPANNTPTTRKTTPVIIRWRGMTTSLICLLLFFERWTGGECRRQISRGLGAWGAEPTPGVYGTV